MIKDENYKRIFTFVAITLIALVAILISAGMGFDKGIKHQVERSYNVHKEMPIKTESQTPFQSNLDFDRITNSIPKPGEHSSPQGFNDFSRSLKQIHSGILEFFSEKLDLTEEEKQSVLKNYNEYHKEFAGNYYDQLIALNESASSPKEESFITYGTAQSVRNLSSILSSDICSLAGFVITLATSQSKESSPLGMLLGKPCQFLLSAGLNPILRELKRRAVIQDFTVSRISLKKHIRKMIVEMGTVKDNFRTVFNEDYTVKLIFGLKSRANLRLHVKSIVKAGFKLDKFFKLEFHHETKEIVLTLPEPEILSNEIDAKVKNIEDGWFVKIDEEKLNRMNKKVREWSYKEAIKRKILENARANAELILKTIFQPIVLATDPEYKISIKFKVADNLPIENKTDDLEANEEDD